MDAASPEPWEWNTIPTSLLRAELLRRQANDDPAAAAPAKPPCGAGVATKNYNTGIHVAALVIVLALSTFACTFPLLARRFPALPVPRQFLFLSRHFGTGVLLATAFVHLLPTAFVSLTNPCLPAFWNRRYPAMAGLIAMLAVMVVVAVEMYFAMKGAGHAHAHGAIVADFEALRGGGGGGSGWERDSAMWSRDEESEALNPRRTSADDPSSTRSSADRRRRKSADEAATAPGSSAERMRDPLDDNDELRSEAGSDLPMRELRSPSDPTPHAPRPTADHAAARTTHLQVLLLEAGILFHSVFIGLSVSLTSGAPFAVLLVAVCFHQTFEGLALGSRIAGLDFSAARGKPQSYIPGVMRLGWLTPYVMCLAFGLTVPLGQALGLLLVAFAPRVGAEGGAGAAFDPTSEAGLLLLGISNAISSGLLLFSGLVTLVADDFLSEESYRTLRGRQRGVAGGMVVLGAVAMSLVGAWA